VLKVIQQNLCAVRIVVAHETEYRELANRRRWIFQGKLQQPPEVHFDIRLAEIGRLADDRHPYFFGKRQPVLAQVGQPSSIEIGK
jgi:hypothetical protein